MNPASSMRGGGTKHSGTGFPRKPSRRWGRDVGARVRKDGPRGRTGLTKIAAGVWHTRRQPSRAPNAARLTSGAARCAPVYRWGNGMDPASQVT